MKDNENRCILPLVTKDTGIVKVLSVFKGIIGQKKAINQLKWFAQNYSELVSFPDLLFTGGAGLGKTMSARKIAEALGRTLIEVNCSTIKTVEEFVMGILIGKVYGETPKTIFFDEAHALSEPIKDMLLTLLNVEDKSIKYLDYGTWRIEYDSSKINVIFATTEANLMDKALLNRLEEVYFTTYNNKDLFDILCFYSTGIKILCDKEDIAYACRGRARDAVKLSKKIKMYCEGHDGILDNKGWAQIKETFGIHACGLNEKEVELMKILSGGSALSSASIAAKMGVNVSNVEGEIETRPRELGFIENGSRGRSLTEKGREYLRG